MKDFSNLTREELIEMVNILEIKVNESLKNEKGRKKAYTSEALMDENISSVFQQLSAANQQLEANDKQIRRNLDQFKALFDGIEDVIYVADPDTYELVHVNETARKIWGTDMVGKKCYKALQNRSEPCPFCTNNIIFNEKTGETLFWEFQNEVDKHWYRCADRAIDWPDGRKLRFEIASDITYLKQSEEKLKAANQQLMASEQQLKVVIKQLDVTNQQLATANQQLEASEKQIQSHLDQFKALLDGIDDVIYVSDPDSFKLVHVNDTAEKFWGKNVIGEQCYKVLQHRDEPCPFCTNDIIFNQKPGETHFWEFQNEVNKHWFRCADKAIQWPDGRKLRFELASDITSIKHAEEKLEALNAELTIKTQELQQFLYITTHDLRSPLVNVQGFSKELEASTKELTEILEIDNLPLEIKKKCSTILEYELPESIHYITTSIEKMDVLLKGLLQISRLGRQKFVFETLMMNSVLLDVIKSFKYEFDKSGVDIRIGELPRCWGDRDTINQLFSNLIGNSLKFMSSDRKPMISIDGEAAGEFSHYIVKDNGIGIHPDHQNKVFELFHKLDPNKPGSGLGMNIVKQIIEKHNGNISLESQPDQGTTVHIFLPGIKKTNIFNPNQ